MRIGKYVFCFLLLFLISFKVYSLDFGLQSNNAILYDEDKIIYEKNSDEKIQIASLTKIMTAIVTLDNIDNLDEKVVITNSDLKGLAEKNLVTAGFKTGDTVTYRDLLYGLLLPSGADAAKALSRLVGGSEEKFIKLMNEKAKELSLKNTHFTNPIGLDDENNYSTINDVYTMFRYGLENNDFKEIITSKNYTSTNGLTFYSSVLKSKNDYILGGKTGTTDGAGLCLASFADVKGEELILITAGAPYDKLGLHHLEDADYVYNYIADNYNNYSIVSKGDKILTLNTVYAKNDKVDFYADKDIDAFLPNNYDKEKITYKYAGIEEVTTNQEKGEKIGTLSIYYDNDLIESIDILLTEKQEFSITKYLWAHKFIVFGIILLIVLIIFIKRCFKRPVRRKSMI